MNAFIDIAVKYVRGNSIIAEARRIVNLFLNIAIASWMYHSFYGGFDWLDYADYKSIISFIVDGKFLIPLCFLILAYCITQFISWLLFIWLNSARFMRLKTNVVDYEKSKEDRVPDESKREPEPKYLMFGGATKEELRKATLELVKDIKTLDFYAFRDDLQAGKIVLRYNFHFGIRFMIALTLCFVQFDNFSWIVFTPVMIIAFVSTFLFIIAYRYLDILPSIVMKYYDLSDLETTGYKMEKKEKNE